MQTADNLVYAGVAFLSIGMLLGSLWAKEAWGNYWSWDPKETWAVITWMGYLIYIHLRLCGQQITVCVAHFFLFGVANVLVWSELSSGGTAKYTFI